MNCEYFKELISARLDGELTPEENTALSEHLGHCEKCGQFMTELEELKTVTAGVEQETMPSELERVILKTTARKPQESKSIFGIFRSCYRIPRGLVWAGVLALILLTANTIRVPFKTSAEAEVASESVEKAVLIQRITLSEEDVVMTNVVTEKSNNL